MKNLTITLDDATLQWARVHAAERGISISRMVGEMLRAKMRKNGEYERAMRQFLSLRPLKLKKPGERYLTREEIHDRRGIR
jgi:hypothetical protein